MSCHVMSSLALKDELVQICDRVLSQAGDLVDGGEAARVPVTFVQLVDSQELGHCIQANGGVALGHHHENPDVLLPPRSKNVMEVAIHFSWMGPNSSSSSSSTAANKQNKREMSISMTPSGWRKRLENGWALHVLVNAVDQGVHLLPMIVNNAGLLAVLL